MIELAELEADTAAVMIDEPYVMLEVEEAMWRSDLEALKAKIRAEHEPAPEPPPTRSPRDAILVELDRALMVEAKRRELALRTEELRLDQELERVRALLTKKE